MNEKNGKNTDIVDEPATANHASCSAWFLSPCGGSQRGIVQSIRGFSLSLYPRRRWRRRSSKPTACSNHACGVLTFVFLFSFKNPSTGRLTTPHGDVIIIIIIFHEERRRLRVCVYRFHGAARTSAALCEEPLRFCNQRVVSKTKKIIQEIHIVPPALFCRGTDTTKEHTA
jgi:hypothetical protein